MKISTPCMFFILPTMVYIDELMTKMKSIHLHQMKTPYEESLT